MKFNGPTLEFNKKDVVGGSKTICVLGTPRGGTSMIAGILRVLGVNMGENLDVDTNEDIEFLLHEGRRDVFSNVFDRERYLGHVKEVVSTRNSLGGDWGWKDPLSSYYIADLAPVLNNLHVIIVWRDAVATIQGEGRFRRANNIEVDELHVMAGLENINKEYFQMLQFVRSSKVRTLMLSYEKFIHNKRSGINDIAKFLGYSVTADDMNFLTDYVSPERRTAKL